MSNQEMRTRILCVALVGSMVVGLAACGSKPNTSGVSKPNGTESSLKGGTSMQEQDTSGSNSTGLQGSTGSATKQTDKSGHLVTNPQTGSHISGATLGSSHPGGSQSSNGNQNSGTTTTVSRNEANQEISFYQNIINTECQWLASFQLSNGALPMTPAPNSMVKVSPYFSDFAALALLDGGSAYYGNVKRYIDWHMSHLNTAATDYNGVDGTIYDYNITSSNNTVTREQVLIDSSTGKKSYDSTDSYAATFLTVLNKYYERSGDKATIEKYYKEIARIINAMRATLHNGLTYAKPDYQMQYFMDNAEVYEGTVAAEKLYQNVITKKYPSTSSVQSTLTGLKAQVSSAIESQLWNSSTQTYRAYAGQTNFSWNTFYADATCQGFAVNCGVISPASARAKQLYASFNQHYSTGESKKSWENISIPDSFYWGSLAYTGALMGDTARVKTYMTKYQIIMKRHAYPLYNADCGKVVMAARVMVDYYKGL